MKKKKKPLPGCGGALNDIEVATYEMASTSKTLKVSNPLGLVCHYLAQELRALNQVCLPLDMSMKDVYQIIRDLLKPEHAPYLITVSPACAEIAAKLLTERKAP